MSMNMYRFKVMRRGGKTHKVIRKTIKTVFAETKVKALMRIDEWAYENGYNDYELITELHNRREKKEEEA